MSFKFVKTYKVLNGMVIFIIQDIQADCVLMMKMNACRLRVRIRASVLTLRAVISVLVPRAGLVKTVIR